MAAGKFQRGRPGEAKRNDEHFFWLPLLVCFILSDIKLIFFADRYHIRKYGRPITNDEYLAMDFGPVNSGVKDIAEMSGFLDREKGSTLSNLFNATGSTKLNLLRLWNRRFSLSQILNPWNSPGRRTYAEADAEKLRQD